MSGASSGKPAMQHPPHGSDEPSTVHVAGIPSDASKQDLEELFKKLGGPAKVTLNPRKGKNKSYAFVKYENEALDSEAIQKFNNSSLTVSFSKAGTKQSVDQGTFNSKSQGDISYQIGDDVESYIEFIAKLRQKFASRKGDVVDDIFEDDKNRACGHPLLVAKPSDQKAVSWIHVELSEKKMGMQTTLVVRKDNLYVKGFMNKDEQWFEVPGRDDNKRKLPGNYQATELKGWDDRYMGIMKLCNKDQVKKTLKSTRLDYAFAERAVRRLSRYHSKDADNDMDEHPTRLGLAGLFVMISEAARMNPFLDTIAGGWNGGTGLTSRLFDIMWDWGSMSAALLKWKESGYRKWPIKSKRSQGTALASIHLVLDSKDVEGSGPAWVEIFAISADFPVIRVTVIDEGKCKHTIYNKQETEQVMEEQRQQGMLPLKLSVKDSRISGYESFDMEVVFPPSAGSGDSITKNFKCDCRKQDADVTQLVRHTINLDPRRKIDVTYLVMHNVAEVTVEVKLRLKGDQRTKDIRGKEPEGVEGVANKVGGKKYTAWGKITAQTDGFEDHQIVLFRTEEGELFPLDIETSIVMRSVVSVPHGKQLHIDMAALDIKEASGDRPVKKPGRLSFEFGKSTPTVVTFPEGEVDDNGNIVEVEVEVNVAWPAQEEETIEKKPDVVFTIGDKREMFIASIEELRGVLACHLHAEDVVDDYSGKALGRHPVLARAHYYKKLPGWKHVKLEVVAAEETSSTTLAVRDDRCSVAGFMNQNGVWYELGNDRWGWPSGVDKQLPPGYNSVLLGWANPYLWLLGNQYTQLITKRLGKDFASAAVRTLSRYPDVEEHEEPMLALAGLMIMVCESAKFNAIFESIATAAWDTGMEFTDQLFKYILSWREISEALLQWKDFGHNNSRWDPDPVNLAGISCPQDALGVVCLVYNIEDRTKKIDMDYIIEDKEGYTTFIKKLRAKLAHHDHPESILDGHPKPDLFSTRNNPALLARSSNILNYRWPARLIHIKIQLAEKETSTTLAVRDDDAYLFGFMNQKGVWHDLDKVGMINYPTLNWGSYRDILGIRYMHWHRRIHDSAWDKVREELGTEGLGKDFAMKAVRTLSCYPNVEEEDLNPKVALAGLSIMFCESARLTRVHEHIENGWDDVGTGFSQQLMEYIQYSDPIAENLLRWKDRCYNSGWPDYSLMWASDQLWRMGIHRPEDALDFIHLVPNTRKL